MLRKKVMSEEITREEAHQMLGKDVFEKQGKVPAKNWPTPTARDWKDSGKAVVNSPRHSLPQTVAKNDKEQWIKGGGALNPTWVEWLMGYPAGYTDLKDWEMLSSRKLRKKSEKPS